MNRVKEKNGGCALTASLPTDSVLTLLLSLIALNLKHTLSRSARFCVQNDNTFFGNHTQGNISTVSNFKLLLFAAYPFLNCYAG